MQVRSTLFNVFDVAVFNQQARLRAYWLISFCQATYLQQDFMTHLATVAGHNQMDKLNAHETPDIPPDGSPFGVIGRTYPVPDAWLIHWLPTINGVLKRHMLLVVRGTVGAREWAHNLGTFQPEQQPAGSSGSALYYHAVCARAIYQFWGGIIDGQTDSGQPLVSRWGTTGHSLGGAIAALFASDYPIGGSNGLTKVHNLANWCVDFAAPRTLTVGAASDQAGRPRQRITNQGDTVTQVPPRIAAAGITSLVGRDFEYMHWGKRLNLHEDGTVTRPSGDPPNAYAAGVIDGFKTAHYLTSEANFAAHASGEYARRIRAGIPVRFPATADDPDYPGLKQLDQFQLDVLNGAAGPTRELPPPPEPPRWEPPPAVEPPPPEPPDEAPGLQGNPPVFRRPLCGS